MSPASLLARPLETPGYGSACAPYQSRHLPPKRILVVDDDTGTRQLYSKILIHFGYQVDTAEDGEAGWQALHAVNYNPDSYDLLITDNNMPNLSGVELVQKLRSAHMTLPVILVSAAPINTGQLQLAAILPKPISPDQLVQAVKEVLQTTRGDCQRGVHPVPSNDRTG